MGGGSGRWVGAAGMPFVRRDQELLYGGNCQFQPASEGTHCWPKLSWSERLVAHFCDNVFKKRLKEKKKENKGEMLCSSY